MAHQLAIHQSIRRAFSSKLLLMTSLPAVDGTIFALAARGTFGTLGGATLAGLTVIAGASAWAAARHEFGREADRVALALVALASTLGAALSAAAGAAFGARAALEIFPTAAGLAVLAIAAEVLGARLPRAGRVPFPAVIVAAGALGEVARWTL